VNALVVSNLFEKTIGSGCYRLAPFVSLAFMISGVVCTRHGVDWFSGNTEGAWACRWP